LEEFENVMNALKKEVIEETLENKGPRPVQFLKSRIDNYEGHLEDYGND